MKSPGRAGIGPAVLRTSGYLLQQPRLDDSFALCPGRVRDQLISWDASHARVRQKAF
jgi:hypothetical protein